MSCLGVFSHECYTFLEMLEDLDVDKKMQKYCVERMIALAIRASYYIFCCRNKEWSNPDLLTL